MTSVGDFFVSVLSILIFHEFKLMNFLTNKSIISKPTFSLHRYLFVDQGIMLISALEERMEDGQVWKYLLERGMTKNKLIKEWKIKSYFLAGKSELLRKEYDTSIALLEAGLKILENDPSAAAEITKLKDLHLNASKRRSAELKKEKSTWAKAFQKNKEEPDVAPVVLMDEEVIVENAENFEEILKGMNAAPKKIKNTVKIVENVKEEEEVGEDVVEVNDDAVSDEAFGWLVGATTIIGFVAIAAFYLLKSKQR